MKKYLILTYGVLAYISALIFQFWFILYLTDFDFISNINNPQTSSTIYAISIDILLVLLFGLQHSLMARDWFKDIIKRYIPQVIERSTYVFFSGIGLFLIVYFWQNIDGYIWKIDSGFGFYMLSFLFVFGWLFSTFATFIINHFELFGLQQVYHNFKDVDTKDISFTKKMLYKYIRHPIQLGVIMGLWFSPTMSYGHFLLSFTMTIYIFIGLHYEEKNLMDKLGDEYMKYRQEVGMVLPLIKNY